MFLAYEIMLSTRPRMVTFAAGAAGAWAWTTGANIKPMAPKATRAVRTRFITASSVGCELPIGCHTQRRHHQQLPTTRKTAVIGLVRPTRPFTPRSIERSRNFLPWLEARREYQRTL